MKITNETLAIKWAKQNKDAIVTRPGVAKTLGKVKSFINFEYYFSNFWEEILVTTGVNIKDYSLIFTKLVDLEVDFKSDDCINEYYLEKPNCCPFCGFDTEK